MKKIEEPEIERYDFTKHPYTSNRLNDINSNFFINEIRRRSLSAENTNNNNNNVHSSSKRKRTRRGNIFGQTFDKIRSLDEEDDITNIRTRKFSMQQIFMPISCLIFVCCIILLIWRTIELDKRLTEIETYMKTSKTKFNDNSLVSFSFRYALSFSYSVSQNLRTVNNTYRYKSDQRPFHF